MFDIFKKDMRKSLPRLGAFALPGLIVLPAMMHAAGLWPGGMQGPALRIFAVYGIIIIVLCAVLTVSAGFSHVCLAVQGGPGENGGVLHAACAGREAREGGGKRLLFISFIDFGNMSSGSSVRPQRMYEAFVGLGYEVELLSGLQNRRLERLKNVFKTYRQLKRTGLPELCYVEPPSGPFFNLCDHLLLIWLKRCGVPIGLFYRDAVWKFADWWQVKGLKRLVLVAMHRFDLIVIRRTCRVVFFPTQSMAELFRLPGKGVLPPAGEDRLTASHGVTRQAVYVGGVSGRYGTDILLGAFELLNQRLTLPVELKLVCRESASSPLFDGYRDRPWLEIISASGPRLEPIYRSCDLALFSGRRDVYMDFCMPVKLFEYISYGLPVVTTDCIEAARFVRENGLGLVSHDDAQSFADCIERFYSEPELLKAAAGRCAATLRQGNLWVDRARQAAQAILG